MRSVFLSSLIAIVAGFGVLAAGCNRSDSGGSRQPAPPSSTSRQQPADAPAPPETKKADTGGKGLPEGLAELSEADRALALKQNVCPVSGESLGSMGKPVKVEVKGRTVFLCCDGCEAELKKEPDKFLAKLDAAGKK